VDFIVDYYMSELRSFLLSNEAGDEICITNFGARIVQWHTLVNNIERNIVLGYSSLSDYVDDSFYLGAIVGPYANIIANASCIIEEQLVNLQVNEGIHHFHGGHGGLSDVYWEVVQQDEKLLVLSYLFENECNGYPGNIEFEISFTLTEDSSLNIKIVANSESTTIVGPTCLAYFNLAGDDQSANEHLLQLNSQYYTEVDDKNVPTGNILSVDDSRFDLTKPRILNNEDERDFFDHNFVINRQENWQAILISPDKKLQLHVNSDYPGIHVNTGEQLSEKIISRGKGICLAPQFFPDSPNQGGFPFQLTSPDNTFTKEIQYKLVKLNQDNEE